MACQSPPTDIPEIASSKYIVWENISAIRSSTSCPGERRRRCCQSRSDCRYLRLRRNSSPLRPSGIQTRRIRDPPDSLVIPVTHHSVAAQCSTYFRRTNAGYVSLIRLKNGDAASVEIATHRIGPGVPLDITETSMVLILEGQGIAVVREVVGAMRGGGDPANAVDLDVKARRASAQLLTAHALGAAVQTAQIPLDNRQGYA